VKLTLTSEDEKGWWLCEQAGSKGEWEHAFYWNGTTLTHGPRGVQVTNFRPLAEVPPAKLIQAVRNVLSELNGTTFPIKVGTVTIKQSQLKRLIEFAEAVLQTPSEGEGEG
jgi:hypothetical protein